MNNELKTVRVNRLLDFYIKLLTIKQQEIMNEYFYLDFSLHEIANTRNISRSAVLDTINKSIVKLEDYENKLELIEKFDNVNNLLEEIKNKDNEDIILKIKEDLKYGI